VTNDRRTNFNGTPAPPDAAMAPNGKAIFAAVDPLAGNELFASDGSAGGHRLLFDVNCCAARIRYQMQYRRGHIFISALSRRRGDSVYGERTARRPERSA